MGRLNDLTGMKFSRLTVIERSKNAQSGDVMWLCECECGTRKAIRGSSLVSGHTVSCGCYCRERHTKHGGEGTRLYGVWRSMIDRCCKPSHPAYPEYGGRGIKVCEDWLDFNAFREWAMISGYDADAPNWQCTLDRIDNNEGYNPTNCRWVDMKVQGCNKRNNRMLEHGGERHTLSEWAEILGVGYQTLYARITRYGWDSGAVLGKSVDMRFSHKRGVENEQGA